MPGNDLLVAVLGAGLASRFGGGKLDAPCHGRPLGQWAVETALGLCAPVVVVVPPGPHAYLEPFAARLAGTIVNPFPESGQGRSVALAAAAAQEAGAGLMLLLLADMPLVRGTTLLALVDAARKHGIAATRWPDGRRGVPACFGRAHFPELAGLDGEVGARDLLRRCPEAAVLTPRSEQELSDVDRSEDLARAEALLAANPAGR